MRRFGHPDRSFRRIAVLILSLLGPVAPCLSAEASRTAPTSANVILITISSLRAGHVSSLGYQRNTTPHFDAFARSSILFRNAYATSSWVMPVHGSIFTSLYPTEHGATHIEGKSLKPGHPTQAGILADRGYYCAGFCGNPHMTSETGLARGFHSYDDFSVPALLTTMTSERGEPVDVNRRRTNDVINSVVMKWLEHNQRRPFFLFVHYYDNHWDYCPPPPYATMFDPNYQGPMDGTRIAREPLYSNKPGDREVAHMVALYDGEVRQTDADVGQLLDFLKGRGLFENSIVVVLGDHGEQFYEHGNTSHHGLYDELIHVPLAVSVPEMSGRPRIVDSLVSQVDLLPTVLDYLRVPAPVPCRGVSLLPLILGRRDTARPYILAEYTGSAVGDTARPHILAEYTGGAVEDVFAIRSTRYKCLQEPGGRVFAYDLSADPEETRRLPPAQFPRDVQDLAAVLACWTKTLIKEAPNVSPGR